MIEERKTRGLISNKFLNAVALMAQFLWRTDVIATITDSLASYVLIEHLQARAIMVWIAHVSGSPIIGCSGHTKGIIISLT